MISEKAVELGAEVMANLSSIDAPRDLDPRCWYGSVRAILEAALPALTLHEGWQPIETAPTGDDDFYLVSCADKNDDRSPFVVRGSIFASARRHPVEHHLSLAYLTHWMPLPAPPALIAEDGAPKPRPTDCGNRMNCGWHKVRTEPDVNLWLCHDPGCGHGIRALSSQTHPSERE